MSFCKHNKAFTIILIVKTRINNKMKAKLDVLLSLYYFICPKW